MFTTQKTSNIDVSVLGETLRDIHFHGLLDQSQAMFPETILTKICFYFCIHS